MRWDPARLERVACDLCGAQRTRPVIVRADGLSVVECEGCGLAYLDPRPDHEALAELYRADYFAGGQAQVGYEGYLEPEFRRSLARLARARLRTLRAHLDPRGKRCLEIGCASGEFCAALAGAGAAHVVGIDIAEQALALARTNHRGIDFRSGTPEQAVAADESFDCIFGFEVIEHMPAPSRLFERARGLLGAGGWLVLSTPNYGCAARLGAAGWLGFQSSFEHLYFFSQQAIERYAARFGFVPEAVYSGGGDGACLQPAARRSLLKPALAALGLLGVARRIRTAAWERGRCWRPGADSHDLLLVLRKSGGAEPLSGAGRT